MTICLISCKDAISNSKYRNENYVFYKEDGKDGEWRKINPNVKNDLPKSFSSYFFPNGNRYAELEVIDSFPNRIIKYFDINDQLTKEVKYQSDTVYNLKYEEGYLEFYHSNFGIKSKEGKVENGLEQGLWKRYNEDGVLIKEFNLKDGLDHGKRIDYFSNGNIEGISNWENNLQVGLAKYYYDNGNIKEVNYVKNKKLHGECIEYYQSGQIESHEYFWKGKRIDTCKYYYQNGNMRIIQVFNLDTISLKSSGTQKNYYENGELKAKITFNDKHAKLKLYYLSGRIREVSEKWDNKHDGNVIVYHENGSKMLEGNAKRGYYHGPIRFFDESGKLKKTVNYDYGNPIDSIMQ